VEAKMDGGGRWRVERHAHGYKYLALA